MIDMVRILVHWHAGRSDNEIGASLGVDRKKIRKYVGPAEAAGLVPAARRWPRRSGRRWHGSGSRNSPTPGCGR